VVLHDRPQARYIPCPAFSVSHKKCFTTMDFNIVKQALSINLRCI